MLQFTMHARVKPVHDGEYASSTVRTTSKYFWQR